MLGLTPQQAAAIAIVVIMLGIFVWDRWRYDVVAMGALLAAVVVGIVPQDKAFVGFSDQVIVVMASVLVVSKAVARSGVLDRLVRRLMKGVDSPSAQIGMLSMSVGLLSAFVKNVGTLGIFMPIAIQIARRSKQSPSIYLMPLAFASLIGGTITQIGTSPNLLISTVREDLVGEGFSVFDYAWVGLPLTLVCVAYLAFGWRILPRDRQGTRAADERFSIEDYTTELVVGAGSPLVGKTVGDLEHAGTGDAVVVAVMREGGHNYIPNPNWPLFAGDIVTVQAEPATIKELVEEVGLDMAHARELARANSDRDELSSVEVIVTADSPIVGQTPRSLKLRQRYDVNLLAVSRAGSHRAVRLQSHTFAVGDVIVLQGWEKGMQQTLADLGLLPLADRSLGLGRPTRGLVALAVLAVAMILITFKLVTVAVGFFAAAAIVMITKQIPLKDGYDAIEGPVIVLLACLIPIAHSLQDTGVTDLIGQQLASIGAQVPGYLAVGMMLGVAMLLTPLLNNAAAVLMLGPVAGVVAKSLNYNPDAFLMAVALGCACDFLTPIGHQNNLLVMGPGGYRFNDYWRLGAPLSLIVLLLGTPLLMFFWPL
jgi:di/tricarboxylate transporter